MVRIEKKTSWDQPCCERCWIKNTSTATETPDGNTKVQLRNPIMVKNATAERCRWCDQITIVGIYVRFDPKEVPFPEPEEPSIILGPTGERVN